MLTTDLEHDFSALFQRPGQIYVSIRIFLRGVKILLQLGKFALRGSMFNLHAIMGINVVKIQTKHELE